MYVCMYIYIGVKKRKIGVWRKHGITSAKHQAEHRAFKKIAQKILLFI